MERVLEPEWLDELPPEDQRALRSRGDLARINALMGNARLIAHALQPLPANARVADLGAGDGRLMLRVARVLGRPGIELTLVDRVPAPLPSFEEFQWNARAAIHEVQDFLKRPGERFDAMVANLFLHHFDDAELRELLALAAERCTLFIACEPRRSAFALQASRLLWLLGCNDVTRHDAVISVRAGFRGDELSRLWPRGTQWRLSERAAWPFSHLFVARRGDAL
jgi:hypothetical protein